MVVTPVRDNLIYSAQYDKVREQLPGFQWDSNQGYFQGADVTDSWSEPAWFPSSITDVQRVIRGQMVFVQPGVHAPSAQLLVVSCTACTALMSRPCPRLPLVCPNEWEDNRPTMRAYALTQLHDPEAIELFITEEDARRALEQCLQDEPQWRGTLEATEVELDHEHTSLN